MMSPGIFNSPPLSKQSEQDLIIEHEMEIGALLPMLGPLFGVGVILFSIWDFLIDPVHAPVTLGLRIGLVLLGAIAYSPSSMPWTVIQRCGFIYCTHAGAIILSIFLLNDGFLFGLAGISACVFTVSMVTFRVKTLLLILALPTILFATLLAIGTPLVFFINGLMLYIFSVSLACLMMLVMRASRRKAFLLEKELTHISRHDGLTGACNRRCLTELADRAIAAAKRHGHPLAIVMLDIDYFKRVNDTYGHDVGDDLLKLCVKICQDNLREIDHFGRIGGEEFVCVLPETSRDEAMLCAERLRQSIAAARLETPQGDIQFTASFGVALLDKSAPDFKGLLKAADDALYRAKDEGRNRVLLNVGNEQNYATA